MRIASTGTLLTVLAFAHNRSRGAVAEEQADPPDPYLWLEEVQGERALEWVEAQSNATASELESVPQFADIRDGLLEIYNSADRIPHVAIRGDWLYNYWRDAEHVRGIWRRTTLEDYIEKDFVQWDTVLDLDAISEEKGENWVWKRPSCLVPDYRRCMVALSRGGGDASVHREYDVEMGTFVEGGFVVPEGKSFVSWKDEDTLWVATSRNSTTTSGYPRVAKEWTRGTSLDDAATVFEGEVDDVLVEAYSYFTPERRYDMVQRAPSFYTTVYFHNTGDELIRLDIPEDATFYGFFKGQMLIRMRSDWTVEDKTYPSDGLLAIAFDDFLEGDRSFQVLFEPSERVAFGGLTATADYLIYSTLDNINGKLYRAVLGDDGGWVHEAIALPGLGTVAIGSASYAENYFFFTYTDYTTPSSLYFVNETAQPKVVKSTPEWYDAAGVTVEQRHATSKDGTEIPYFIVMPADFEANGANPTLLYGYGGFQISLVPIYSGSVGSSWIERGGVYVVANIRGGGEFGPDWHKAAVRELKQTNFDDFIAVAEDLIARNVTSPDHLGIEGGSQGGFLVGGSFVQRPDLFGAVVCQVPLLDMKRYNKLLAGASWMDEYGDPDTDDWDDFMISWSPYHNLDPETDYPRVFFYTSTNDDRVHPGHARKMAAKMLDMNKPVYYFENTEGGHGGAANNNEQAYMGALTYSYLWKMLGSTDSPLEPTAAPTMGSTTAPTTSAAAMVGGVLQMVTAFVLAVMFLD